MKSSVIVRGSCTCTLAGSTPLRRREQWPHRAGPQAAVAAGERAAEQLDDKTNINNQPGAQASRPMDVELPKSGLFSLADPKAEARWWHMPVRGGVYHLLASYDTDCSSCFVVSALARWHASDLRDAYLPLHAAHTCAGVLQGRRSFRSHKARRPLQAGVYMADKLAGAAQDPGGQRAAATRVSGAAGRWRQRGSDRPRCAPNSRAVKRLAAASVRSMPGRCPCSRRVRDSDPRCRRCLHPQAL